MTTPRPDAEETARIESAERLTPRYGTPEPQFTPGSMIAGRYRIAGILGKGGMGEVYRADDVKLGQTVALKFLPARLARDPILLAHLHDEVRHGRQVSHPNVCRTYDIGEADGAHFVAMEFVDGEDLARLLHRIGRLAHDKAVDIARGIAAGLMAAHAKGILHRDLKPANVMIDSHGDARITDFGLALSATDIQDGGLAGTPAYMAPELLQGEPATVQSDLYALGLVMYELFTGHRAHTSKTLPDRIRELTSEITLPSNHIRDIDPAVERVILRCLSSESSQRPRSARAVIEALPGGDPLAAAMAAGETPSPRIVAAAGTEGSLSRRVAWSLLIATIVMTTAAVMLQRSQSISHVVPFERSPEVLFDRMQTIAGQLGVPTKGRPIHGVYERLNFQDWLAKREGSHVAEAMRNGPGLLLFRSEYGVSDAESRLEPLLATAPGRTTIDVDTQGRLSSLLVAPEKGDIPQRPLNWPQLLALAGLSDATLTAIPPAHAPPVPFDARAAWSGAFANSRTPIRVEAAAWHGMPVFFRITGDWDRGDFPELPAPFAFAIGVIAVLIVVTCALAWNNFRRRRGDRNGALRVAAAVFILKAIASLLEVTWSSNPFLALAEAIRLLGSSLGNAAIVYMVYLAIEPYLRRRWPDRLIAWSRLVSGRLHDPMVGRDVLIGLTAGAAYALIAAVSPVVARIMGITAAPEIQNKQALLGAGQAMSVVISNFISATSLAFFTMTVLVLATIVLHRRLLAAAVLFVIVGSVFLLAASVPLPIALAAATLLTYIPYHYGLLTSLLLFALQLQIFRFPIVDAPWATPLAAIPCVTLAVLAIWAFRTSLGGHSAFAETLEDA
ncbi:MAG: eukaryotic-like serine/threonine-protein kinase [Acidobacteriota bacterium]|jgi:serine/threonine-protein kinase|nr:eukaryotic-like serine/threonine-protein kinase [Acidobacteriota bacterium]